MNDDIKKVNSIISRSGNNFHCKVLKYLKDKGWTVLISPYYNDNISGKPREIDLIAEKYFDCIIDYWGKPKGSVSVKLYIECKHITQENVFWFYDKEEKSAIDLVVSTTPMERGNIYTNKHHYLENKERVAKLFADGKSNTSESEVFYKALNQCLNAMIYNRGKGTIINREDRRREFNKVVLEYPVIVCNSFKNLYRVDIDSEAEVVNINNNFNLEVNYSYLNYSRVNIDEYFLIDVVNFEDIDQFLAKLESDAKAMNVFLND